MTFPERIRLLAFGLFTWSVAMFTANDHSELIVIGPSVVMAAIGAGLFATALLPGRMARFS